MLDSAPEVSKEWNNDQPFKTLFLFFITLIHMADDALVITANVLCVVLASSPRA
ncbi:hypothetical protein OK016_13135 [Vibrio chagasii]|nr:hypothetical protein [Vibrio chagasii]